MRKNSFGDTIQYINGGVLYLEIVYNVLGVNKWPKTILGLLDVTESAGDEDQMTRIVLNKRAETLNIWDDSLCT